MLRRPNRKGRSSRGGLLAEGAAATWVFFGILLFPLISVVTLGYRAVFVYYATRDAAYQGAKCADFSTAKTTAASAVTNDLTSNPQISLVTATTQIVVTPLTGGTPQFSSIPLTTVSTVNNLYFIQENVTAMISGLIPGLPAPFPVTFNYRVYSENPQGLVN